MIRLKRMGVAFELDGLRAGTCSLPSQDKNDHRAQLIEHRRITTMLLRTLAQAVVLAVALIGLTACDKKDKETPPASGLTPPAAELEFGESAELTRGEGEGTLMLTIDPPEEGDASDLTKVGSKDGEGKTVYYLRVEVTPEADTGPIDIHRYLTLFAGNNPLTHLSLFVPYEPCPQSPVTAEKNATAQETCLVYLADPAWARPDRVVFNNDDEYDASDGNAVRWQ